MKAEELFVGAIVRVNRDGLCIKKDTIVKVRAVYADVKLPEKGLVGAAHCRPLDDDQFDGGIWCEYLDPIPLTPEILEKNGWKKDSGGEECWANSKGWFTPHEYGKRETIKSWEVEICGKPNSFDGVIKYVHQFQHALRLCGIDKEIEL